MHSPQTMTFSLRSALWAAARFVQQSWLSQNLVLLVAWLLLWQLGWLVEYTQHASVWFPVAGFTFASLLLMGITALPAILLGCVLINYLTIMHYQLPISGWALLQSGVLFALAHTLPYMLAAYLLRWRAARGKRDITRLLVLFILMAALSSLLATVLVISSLVMTGLMPAADVAKTWLPFWIGDMAGVMVWAPFFLSFIHLLRPGALYRLVDIPIMGAQRPSIRYPLRLAITFMLLLCCLWFGNMVDSPHSAFAIFFLAIPHMWIACSETGFFNVSAVALTSLLLVFGVHWLGLMDNVIIYQFAIIIIAANSLFGLALPTLLAHNLQLRKVAYTDSLTQVASRERLIQRANLEMIKASKSEQPLSILAFDIDYFKQINDQFGHSVGDLALQNLCLQVQQQLQPHQLLGRYGGDEFVVILPNMAAAQALALANLLCARLQSVMILDDVPLRISIGATQWRRQDDFMSWFDRADSALYQAKAQGRNQAVLV